MSSIHNKLIAFQATMPTIKKTENNPFFNSKYADLATIQQAIQKPLSEAGLGYMQMPTNEGLRTIIYSTEGEQIEYVYPARFEGKPQEIGSAVTYAKRYALVAMLGLIIEGDDDDGNTAQQSEKQKYEQDDRPWLTQEQYEAMLAFIDNGQIDQVKNKLKTYKMRKEFRDGLNAAFTVKNN